MNIDIDKMERLRWLKKTEMQELLAHYKLKLVINHNYLNVCSTSIMNTPMSLFMSLEVKLLPED